MTSSNAKSRVRGCCEEIGNQIEEFGYITSVGINYKGPWSRKSLANKNQQQRNKETK